MLGAGWRRLFRGSRSRDGRDATNLRELGPGPMQPEETARPSGGLLPRRWVKAQLPADISGRTGADAGDIVRAAWAPGVHIVIADLTSTAKWTTASLQSLRHAQRDLSSNGAELRLVVWSSTLYAALQATGITSHIPVFANLESALRADASGQDT